MARYDFDIGVLGGGAAGLTVTAGSAQFGAKALLVEKQDRLGGDCLHYGCVPSKTLIRTAQVYHQINNSTKFGLPHIDAQPVDYREVVNRIRSVIGIIQEHDSEERFCSLGAKVAYGSPTFSDEHTIRLDGKNYTAKNWVIATGAEAGIPPIEGLDKTPFITNKDIFYLDDLPRSMIILGGGPIAIEMAQAFCRLGTKVFVVQRSNQILSKEDKDMADQVMQVMASEGVMFHLSSSVVSTKDLGIEKEVAIKDGEGRPVTLRAQAILIALGMEANLEGLGLEGIGIEFSRKGLQLDDRLRTNHKHIYGAGDVTGSNLFTHAAGYEGAVVINNAILHLPKKVNYTYMPWCTYTDPELASIGMNEKRAEAAGINYSVWTEEFRNSDRSLAEGESVGKIKLILDEKGKPLGVQILGPHAGEVLNEWVAILNGKVKLSTLATAVHPYPTIGEINKKVAGAYFSPKIYSDKVKKGLKFFFDLKGRACGR